MLIHQNNLVARTCLKTVCHIILETVYTIIGLMLSCYSDFDVASTVNVKHTFQYNLYVSERCCVVYTVKPTLYNIRETA